MTAPRLQPLLVAVSAVALTTSWVTAQQAPRPMLADYYTPITETVLDARYAPFFTNTAYQDLDGDGNQDLIVLGANYPQGGTIPNWVPGNVPQPGRVFLGDGDGRFTPAPAALFPVDTLMTVHPRKVLFADFNGDGRTDMFISTHGWDGPGGPAAHPGEQNRLYLSLPEGGWSDATDTLPQISDYSHSSSIGDISGRGVTDIFVGNGSSTLAGNGIRSYTLLNNGSGRFTPVSTNIPVGNNQRLDTSTFHFFDGSTLTDLNDDGLPELIVGAKVVSSVNRIRRTTILWNRAGVFVDTDTSELPAPGIFTSSHAVYDVQRIDVNQDGLPDLVQTGLQAGGSSGELGGWFVQVLVNHGDRQFVDETADRVLRGESSGGVEGEPNTAPTPLWVRVLDFNQDGAPDFSVEFNGSATEFTQDQPLIWLNDGAGHFSTLKVKDFVTAGSDQARLARGRLVATRNGYSFITTKYNARPGGWPLTVTGLLATRPYRVPGSNVIPAPADPAPLTPPPDDYYTGYSLREHRDRE